MEIYPLLITAAFGIAILALLAISAKMDQEKKFDRFLATIQVVLDIVVALLAIGLAILFGGPVSIIFWLVAILMSGAAVLGLGVLLRRIIFP